MKKLIFSLSALAALLLAGSCQRENLEPVQQGGTVTYTVQVTENIATKAIGDQITDVDKVYYEVYRAAEVGDLDSDPVYQGEKPVINNSASFDLEFVKNQEFVVLFWAQNSALVKTDQNTDGMYDIDDLRAIELVNPGEANNAAAQVFAGKDTVSDCVSAVNGNVTLTRPVSQINVYTTTESLSFGDVEIELETSSMTVSGLYNTYNVAKGEAVEADENETTFAYAAATVPTVPADNTDLTYVAMNYVGFAPKNGTTVNVGFTINTTEAEDIVHSVSNVPVKPNFRTNITGNLITATTDYNVSLNDSWDTLEDVYVWNGLAISVPQQPANEPNIYEIEFPSELAWLAAAVNGTLPETKSVPAADSFAGKTFRLMNDVDLKGFEWTPIGSSANPFQGTFDGNGKTVKNLVVTGNNSDVGLFGNTNSGEIKNLTVENAKVSGRLNVGVVAGQPYTSKYTNITVTGHVEVNGMAYVGAVGGKNAYADWTDITVNVDETSYVKANSVENGTAYRTYVGGVVGFNGEGGHSFTSITSNINVKGSTCDVGGLFGIAHYGNKFENCVCTGDVEIYAAEESAEADEIGGIAGVWHNENGTQVTFTKCSFDGKFTVNVEGVDLSDNTITGSPYSATGTGKLVIDGKALYKVSEVPAEIDLAEGNTVIVPALSADHKVVVKGNGTLVLNGTEITSSEGAAIELANDANVILLVNDAVALTGAADGILVPADEAGLALAQLRIKGAGNLTTIGTAGSGIDGSVVVDGLANLTAKGNGDHAFGIGGNGAIVTIKNSTVDYVCGGHVQPLFINDTKYGKSEPEGGAAIGGAEVKIENSRIVKADGGSKAAAIGGQYWQSTSVEIVNSTIEEANGGNASAGIGGSRYGSDAKHNVSVTIVNSTVTATGGQFGAGIGAGYDTHCNGQEYEAVNHIEIDGASSINAKGGKYAPGIGTGFHSAYLTGSIAEGAKVNAVAGDETFYKEEYTRAQNIGYGVVDPAREFSGNNANVTFTVAGKVIDYPYERPVAKVGNTEYTSIDAAIANWANNTTLTLLADVTLNDVVTLKSTEHHILDLSTFTITAAEGKNAFVIQACGTGDSERNAITIKANAENPGGINAGKKSIIYYKYADGGISGNDRPIIKIEGGVFTGSTSSWGTAGIYTIGSEARKCATLNISGGTFNCSINGSGKSKLLISGGVFNYSVGSQGDSTALRLISGGTFKTLGFMTADSNNTKFWFGTSMGNSNVGLYINDDNYLVVGGPVITEFGDKFAAKATNATAWSSYLQYSSAAANGLYYTNAQMAIDKHKEANVVLK